MDILLYMSIMMRIHDKFILGKNYYILHFQWYGFLAIYIDYVIYHSCIGKLVNVFFNVFVHYLFGDFFF